MDKMLALIDCLAQFKEAQHCADALLSDILADTVRRNNGKGGLPNASALKAFRDALKAVRNYSYQAEMILAEFEVRQTSMSLGSSLATSPSTTAFETATIRP